MTDFPPFSQLLSRATVQPLHMRCLTFSRVNWLRNGESSKAGEYIWRTLYLQGSSITACPIHPTCAEAIVYLLGFFNKDRLHLFYLGISLCNELK